MSLASIVLSLQLPTSRRHATFLGSIPLMAGLLLLPSLALSQTFIQANSNTVAVNASSVTVTYTNPETAGDLNIVVVGWNDTSSSVTSVVDDNTNIYALAG